MNNNILKGLSWKLLERFGVQGTQFVLQIVLARILDPAHYGMLSIMLVFVNLANVFVQNGFNTALIQNKETKEKDYSSVFWMSLFISGILYAVIFFSAPLIADFYDMPQIISPLRVLALMIFPGALNSVQLAKVTREMNFRKIFSSNVLAVVVSGVAGITVAYLGGGLWALVVQSILNTLIACTVMTFTVKLKLKFHIDIKRIKVLFSFGSKLLCASLMDTLYQDLRSLVIGKKYSSDTLGYYNKGKHFPHFAINAINGAVQSVMLPAMSKEQDDKVEVKKIMRTSITVSSYIIFPMMAGLAAVATPLVKLLLTDKWLPCVPYLQIYCFTLAFYPIHSCNLQAINAVGRSDMFLKLEIIKKFIGICSLAIAVFCFHSPIAIAVTGMITAVISGFINAYPNKKLIDYSYFEQMKDILPSFLFSLLMLVAIWPINFINMPVIITLLAQIIAGVSIYVLISFLIKPLPFRIVVEALKSFFKKKAQK